MQLPYATDEWLAPVKRALIIASSYAPAMPANMHRVRMLSGYLKAFGWDFVVLYPATDFERPEVLEPHPSLFFAPDVALHEVTPHWSDRLVTSLGGHSPNWRAIIPLYAAGVRLLKELHFDLVFFSTTAFNFFCLGRLWQSRFDVPYVLDFHDPWIAEGPRVLTSPRRFKAMVGRALSGPLERFAVERAAGIISVSPHYNERLKLRYPACNAVRHGKFATIPFGAMQSDISNTELFASRHTDDGNVHIAYVGVGSVVMQRSFSRLVQGLARLRNLHPSLIGRLRIRLLGTDGGWAEGKTKILKNEADRAGVGDLVTECPRIVPYSTAISAAASADGLLVLGVDDPAYMASKLFTYAFTGKPLLACIHWHSQMDAYFAKYPDLGSVIHFSGPVEMEEHEDSRILNFVRDARSRRHFERPLIRANHSAEAMTGRVADFFDDCVATGKRR